MMRLATPLRLNGPSLLASLAGCRLWARRSILCHRAIATARIIAAKHLFGTNSRLRGFCTPLGDDRWGGLGTRAGRSRGPQSAGRRALPGREVRRSDANSRARVGARRTSLWSRPSSSRHQARRPRAALSCPRSLSRTPSRSTSPDRHCRYVHARLRASPERGCFRCHQGDSDSTANS